MSGNLMLQVLNEMNRAFLYLENHILVRGKSGNFMLQILNAMNSAFLNSGMLPDAVVPPYSDHTYAQWLERATTLSSPQLSPFKPLGASPPDHLTGECLRHVRPVWLVPAEVEVARTLTNLFMLFLLLLDTFWMFFCFVLLSQ